MEFDKQILFNNISYLIKERGMKIGDFEAATGVSTGYISRTSKEGGAKPGIDFIISAAHILGVSLDILLTVNLEAASPTELYIINFVTKLTNATTENSLEWNREYSDFLNTLNFQSDGVKYVHPLFSEETFYESEDIDTSGRITDKVFVSRSFGVHTYINEDCFYLNMKNGTTLYLMSICKRVRRVNDPDAYAKEVWMYNDGGCTQYLCSTKDSSLFSILLDGLYRAITESTKHPKLDAKFTTAIDAFMESGDLADDPEYNPCFDPSLYE